VHDLPEPDVIFAEELVRRLLLMGQCDTGRYLDRCSPVGAMCTVFSTRNFCSKLWLSLHSNISWFFHAESFKRNIRL